MAQAFSAMTATGFAGGAAWRFAPAAGKRRRNRQLWQGAMEDRERGVQRDEKSWLRTRIQFRPRQKVPDDAPGRSKPSRLRLAFSPRSDRAIPESRTRGRREANKLFRRPPDLTSLSSFLPGRFSSKPSPPLQSPRDCSKI